MGVTEWLGGELESRWGVDGLVYSQFLVNLLKQTSFAALDEESDSDRRRVVIDYLKDIVSEDENLDDLLETVFSRLENFSCRNSDDAPVSRQISSEISEDYETYESAFPTLTGSVNTEINATQVPIAWGISAIKSSGNGQTSEGCFDSSNIDFSFLDDAGGNYKEAYESRSNDANDCSVIESNSAVWRPQREDDLDDTEHNTISALFPTDKRWTAFNAEGIFFDDSTSLLGLLSSVTELRIHEFNTLDLYSAEPWLAQFDPFSSSYFGERFVDDYPIDYKPFFEFLMHDQNSEVSSTGSVCEDSCGPGSESSQFQRASSLVLRCRDLQRICSRLKDASSQTEPELVEEEHHRSPKNECLSILSEKCSLTSTSNDTHPPSDEELSSNVSDCKEQSPENNQDNKTDQMNGNFEENQFSAKETDVNNIYSDNNPRPSYSEEFVAFNSKAEQYPNSALDNESFAGKLLCELQDIYDKQEIYNENFEKSCISPLSMSFLTSPIERLLDDVSEGKQCQLKEVNDEKTELIPNKTQRQLESLGNYFMNEFNSNYADKAPEDLFTSPKTHFRPISTTVDDNQQIERVPILDDDVLYVSFSENKHSKYFPSVDESKEDCPRFPAFEFNADGFTTAENLNYSTSDQVYQPSIYSMPSEQFCHASHQNEMSSMESSSLDDTVSDLNPHWQNLACEFVPSAANQDLQDLQPSEELQFVFDHEKNMPPASFVPLEDLDPSQIYCNCSANLPDNEAVDINCPLHGAGAPLYLSQQPFEEADLAVTIPLDNSLVSQKRKKKGSREKISSKPCSFFIEGSCQRADCKFSHDLNTIPCRYFAEGNCLRDQFCPFLHALMPRCLASGSDNKADLRKSLPAFDLKDNQDFPDLFSNSCKRQRNRSAESALSLHSISHTLSSSYA